MFTSATPDLESPFTQEDVLHQCLIVFGQGTDYLRVNRMAVRTFVEEMRAITKSNRHHERWEVEAVQVLERVRMVGRVAAASATNDGRTVIEGDDIKKAFIKVRLSSKSETCSADAFPSSL